MTARLAEVLNVNPARAGMILEILSRSTPIGGKPRASGDDPYVAGWLELEEA